MIKTFFLPKHWKDLPDSDFTDIKIEIISTEKTDMQISTEDKHPI